MRRASPRVSAELASSRFGPQTMFLYLPLVESSRFERAPAWSATARSSKMSGSDADSPTKACRTRQRRSPHHPTAGAAGPNAMATPLDVAILCKMNKPPRQRYRPPWAQSEAEAGAPGRRRRVWCAVTASRIVEAATCFLAFAVLVWLTGPRGVLLGATAFVAGFLFTAGPALTQRACRRWRP
jgi:hypothetical protein